MREGWKEKTIGEVCDVVNGGTPKTGVSGYWGGSYQWITPAEMGKRVTPYIQQTERTITSEGLRNSSARLLPPHSVILSSRAPIGYLVINTAPMATNQGCKGLVPNKEIDHKFLFYYLESIVKLLNELGSGATFKELSSGKLKEIPIPIAPLPEQRRIVAILDEAFEGIATAKANAEKNLQNGHEVFESHLNAVFSQRGEGWVEKRIDEICSIKHGFAFKGHFFSNNGEYALLTPGNFYESGGYRDRGERQKYYIGDFPREYLLKKGDLLLAMTEQAAGLLGSPILIPDSDRFLHNQRLGLVEHRTVEKFSNEFLFYLFNSKPVRMKINVSASGVKVRHTSPKKIGIIQVCVPDSIAVQRRIADTLYKLHQETQHLESLYQQKLTALDELKQSHLHQAFNGDL